MSPTEWPTSLRLSRGWSTSWRLSSRRARSFRDPESFEQGGHGLDGRVAALDRRDADDDVADPADAVELAATHVGERDRHPFDPGRFGQVAEFLEVGLV